jgi:DNA-directed RNA polymerase subunit D
MKLSIIDAKENKLRFNVSGIDVSMANALRKIVLSEIPTIAIETVTFDENTSILNDEVLGLRLGLVPLKTDIKTYNTIEDCTCKGKGCAKCTVTLTVDVKGPGTVYSKDMKSTDPEIFPVHDTIPIARLTESQAVKFEAKARLGTGKEHAKWQSGIASYEIKEDGSFDFMIESFNQLELSELVGAAFEVFSKKVAGLKEAIKSS